jgi:hypothetical protein
MNLWYKKISVFAVAGVVYLVGQYYRGVWFLGSNIPNVCGHAEAGGVPFCNSPYLETLGWPLILLGQILAIVALIMLFTNAAIFRRWLKFSAWFVPIAALIVIFVFPVPMPLGAELSREGAVRLFGGLYVIITAAIILFSWFKVWLKNRKAPAQKS